MDSERARGIVHHHVAVLDDRDGGVDPRWRALARAHPIRNAGGLSRNHTAGSAERNPAGLERTITQKLSGAAARLLLLGRRLPPAVQARYQSTCRGERRV